MGGVAIATLSSCSDFLDQKSPSDTDASNVWQSTYYTKNVLNKAYGLLCEDYTYSQVLCYTFMTNSDVEFANAYGESNAKAEGKGRDLNNYYADNDASFAKSRDAWDHLYESIVSMTLKRQSTICLGLVRAAIPQSMPQRVMLTLFSLRSHFSVLVGLSVRLQRRDM